MSSIKFELEAEVRPNIGRGASRRLRQDDKIPAVVYGAGEDAISLMLDHNKTMHALSNEAFYSHILTLKVGKKSEKVILKAMQRHPAKPRINHIDFLRVRADQKLQMHVPLHFKGEDIAPGFKEGGIFQHLMADIEVSCLPADLPEFIEIDVSQLNLDDSIHVNDIKLPKGVELATEGNDAAVISLHIPRIVEEEPEPTLTEEASEGEAGATDESKSSDGETGKQD